MPLIQINTVPINMSLELCTIILFPQVNISGKNLPSPSIINISPKMELSLPLIYNSFSSVLICYACLPMNIKHPLGVHKKEEQVACVT
jgi:hypothetical protein